MASSDLRQALEDFLRTKAGSSARVEALRPLAGGASRQIYSFELHEQGAAPRELILRMDPGDGRMQSDRAAEFRLLAAAREAGVTVPAVHWLGEAGDGLGASFIIMDRIEGQAIARRLLRDEQYANARNALPAALARELARIHAIDVDDERLAAIGSRVAGSDGRRFARQQIGEYRSLLDATAGGRPLPVLTLVARHLERNAPEVAAATIVHGDFRMGNIMCDEQGLTAVLDWELAHVGDPFEDVGWLSVRAWRYGVDDKAMGGLCTREEFWRLYEQESGRAVDPRAAAYWELFGNWKWAVICIIQAASHKAGSYPNVELASLGRRVAEVEWELLDLLESG